MSEANNSARPEGEPAPGTDEVIPDIDLSQALPDDAPLPNAPNAADQAPTEAPRDLAAITSALAAIGVRTIVVVDDDVPDVGASVVRAKIQGLDRAPACLTDLSEQGWPAGRAERYDWVKSALDALAFDQRKERTRALYEELAEPYDWWSAISETLARLNETGEVEVVPIHPREWEVHMPNFPLTAIATAETHQIHVSRQLLVLFDNNLSNFYGRPGKEAGLRLARELREQAGDSVLCGIISRAVQEGKEQEAALAALGAEERDRYVIIAKDTIDDSPTNFAYRVARVALSAEVAELRTHAIAALASAQAAAMQALNTLDIDALIHAVVLRSPEEGVSEFETLIRLYSIYFASAIAETAPNEETLQRIVRTLRSKLPIAGAVVPHKLREIRRHEWLVDGRTINRKLAPIASGDIFSIQRPAGGGWRKFVLVMPPCDVQLRRSGRREIQSAGSETTIGTLLPIRAHDEESKSPGFVIEYAEVGMDSSKAWKVHFRPPLYLPLDVLDLCAYTADGRARLTAPAVSPDQVMIPTALPESLEARFRILYARVREIIEASARDVDRRALISQPGAVAEVRGSVNGDTVSYECKRVGRLQPLIAAEVLSALVSFAGRPAREMDFAVPASAD